MSTTVEEAEKTEQGADKNNALLLDSLEIKGYRCFEHLTIEKLGRVNLIVGKNNVGKTALLEALWIYAEGNSWNKVLATMACVLEARNERLVDRIGPSWGKISRANKEVTIKGDEFKHLFFQRPKFSEANFLIDTKRNLSEYNPLAGVRATNNIHVGFNPDVPEVFSKNYRERNFHTEINSLFVPSNGLDIEFLTQVWDEIILSNSEDSIVDSLKIIAPKIIDLNFIGYPKGAETRVPVVRIDGVNERIPLRSLGEGMNRLLGIAIALVKCKNGILLIDEIEIGLHYSALLNVWKLIFKTAKDLNVQVFATTHSKDCIEAFAQAAYDSPEEGMLIRLERHGEKIVAKAIEEEMLVDAVNYEVEVR